jgi:protease II|tara:strand:- start:329 stop:778 length:450 start_codon:yes stop_codon:yes gene_type:complete
MIGKKSSLLIDEAKLIKLFEFIGEGSKVVTLNSEKYLVFKKDFSNIKNEIKIMDFKIQIEFNSVMQGEFPTIELKIMFYKNQFEIESLSHLISMNNQDEVDEFRKFVNNKDAKFILLCKTSSQYEYFQIDINSYRLKESLDNELKNFNN